MLKIFLLSVISVSFAYAQPWTYNFGSATAATHSGSNNASTTFLPQPTAGEDYVSVGNGGGSIQLKAPGDYFNGSGTSLNINATSNASRNKFSVYGFAGTTVSTFKAKMRFYGAAENTGTESGTFLLVFGSGANFSSTNPYDIAQTFTALQFAFGASQALTTSYLVSSSFITTNLTTSNFLQYTNLTIELIMNNSESTVNYNYGVNPNTLAPSTFDLYRNGVLVGNDLPDAGSFTGNINSFMFYGTSSTLNAANLIIDDIMYSNTAEDPAFPVELTSFTSTSNGNAITLNWATATEVDNYGFEVERSADNTTFTKVGFVAGAGNSNVQKQYSFVDGNLTAGTYYYRLKQVDTDGSFEYTSVVSSSISETPATFSLEQNYPNPFNPSTKISFALAKDSDVKLTVFNTLGEEVAVLVNSTLTAGTHTVDFNASNLTSGMYLYKIQAGEFVSVKKMTLAK